MREKKILYVAFGGLGDHLLFSTLPELLDSHGYDFYLSHLSEFRNIQTLDLVWKSNPYFKGISEESPNCGHGYTNLENQDTEITLNRNIEIKMGFEESNLPNKSNYPIIYYSPKKIDKFKDCLFIDLNGHSFKGNGYGYDWEKINQYISEDVRQNNYRRIFIVVPNQTNYSLTDFDFQIEGAEKISVSDIFEYTDMLYSSKRIYTIWSGGSHLASSIKWKYHQGLEIFTFSDNTKKNNFWYDNVNYIRGFMTNSNWI